MRDDLQLSDLAQWAATIRQFLEHAAEDSPGWRAAIAALVAFETFVRQCSGDGTLCRMCAQPFTLTPAERGWFRARRMSQPRRCPACRAARRQRRQQTPQSAADSLTPREPGG